MCSRTLTKASGDGSGGGKIGLVAAMLHRRATEEGTPNDSERKSKRGREAGRRREDTGARPRGDDMVAEEGSRRAVRWLPSPPACVHEDRYAVACSTYSSLPTPVHASSQSRPRSE